MTNKSFTKPTVLLLLFILICGCSSKQQFHYKENQSLIIKSFRERLYYEYSSPLNEAMKIYLELELNKEKDFDLPLQSIYKLEQKLKHEKPQRGCYYLELHPEKHLKLIVLMEWNQNIGVVIRFFTNSTVINDKLPEATF